MLWREFDIEYPPHGRRSPYHILTAEEIEGLKKDIEAICAEVDIFRFNYEGCARTSYLSKLDTVFVKGDVLPDMVFASPHPRDLMSARAVLAHEYYGHRPYRNAKFQMPAGSWNDEFRASYMAAKNAPGLSCIDKFYLIHDALRRAGEAGVKIRHNSFIRGVIYG